MYDVFLMRIQRRNLAPATSDEVTMRSVDLWVGFVEVASIGFVTLRIEARGRFAGPGIRPRLSFIAPASPSFGSGRGQRVLGSETQRVKLGRPPRFSDEGPPLAHHRAVNFVERIGGKKVVLINGDQHAELMIKHGLGVITTKTYEITEVSNDFFDESEG
jgi:hypothetical protein